jgi:hypothetical protein
MNSSHRKTREAESERKATLALVLTAAAGIAISSGILASLIYLLVALASILVRPVSAQPAPAGARVQFQSAINQMPVSSRN